MDTTLAKEQKRAYDRSYYLRTIERRRVLGRAWREKNRERLNGKERECKQRKRQEALTILGGRCVSCGFTDSRALHIDHVNGDGRSDHGGRQRDSMRPVREVLQGNTSKRFQLLCANCNFIKAFKEGERPWILH